MEKKGGPMMAVFLFFFSSAVQFQQSINKLISIKKIYIYSFHPGSQYNLAAMESLSIVLLPTH